MQHHCLSGSVIELVNRHVCPTQDGSPVADYRLQNSPYVDSLNRVLISKEVLALEICSDDLVFLFSE